MGLGTEGALAHLQTQKLQTSPSGTAPHAAHTWRVLLYTTDLPLKVSLLSLSPLSPKEEKRKENEYYEETAGTESTHKKNSYEDFGGKKSSSGIREAKGADHPSRTPQHRQPFFLHTGPCPP